MKTIKVNEVLVSTEGKILLGDINTEIDNIVIDSRFVNDKSMLVAIIGENQNGHKYIKSAYENGCRVFLVSEESEEFSDLENATVILVENTEIALGDIAKCYKQKFNLNTIGITGSVGKTTTRNMVYSVVNEKFKTLENKGNLNNQFGVPLTIFNLEDDYKAAVIEMGMSGAGEIEYLTNIVKPNIGVISNIGTSHIEKLGSQEAIFKTKMEITKDFDESSTLIINGDDKYLATVKEADLPYEVLTFGFSKFNDIYCKSYESFSNYTEFICVIANEEQVFEIPVLGEHNIYNAMAGILVGLTMNISTESIAAGLLNFKPTGDRQQIINKNNLTVINDVYNASPDSMVAALKVLANYDKRKIAIFGDALEMGDFAEQGHRRVGSVAAKVADIIITTGDAAKFICYQAEEDGFDKSKLFVCENKNEVNLVLDKVLKPEDAILVKASRGMKFESIVEYLVGNKEGETKND